MVYITFKMIGGYNTGGYTEWIIILILSVLIMVITSIAIDFYRAGPGDVKNNKYGAYVCVILALVVSILTLLTAFGCIFKLTFFLIKNLFSRNNPIPIVHVTKFFP
jgi:hypothetical protein